MNSTSTLLLINTITPEDVQQLNQVGITQLEDIARLNSQRIESLTTQLNLLQGRIEFEYWVEQAQEHLDKNDDNKIEGL